MDADTLLPWSSAVPHSTGVLPIGEFAPLILQFRPEPDLQAIRRWGMRVGLDAAGAVAIADRLALLTAQAGDRLPALRQFYGLPGISHAFHVEPVPWIRLTEVQATVGLAGFLRAGGSARAAAFLRALDPSVNWPDSLSEVSVTPEMPVPGGRIDILVTAVHAGRTWGAAVEAKVGHHLGDNPLADYATAARKRGLKLNTPPDESRTGSLVVLGRSMSRADEAVLAKNRRWIFVTWSTMLRRLERELSGLPDDDEFVRFRRTLWDRCS